MARYAEREDCLGTVQEGQELHLGCFSTHDLEQYGWVVGFADSKDDMIFVPEGARLMGQDGMEYELRLEKDPRYGGNLGYLYGREERFGLESEVKIDLQKTTLLRFGNSRLNVKFKVKNPGLIEVVGAAEKEPEKPKKGLLRRVLEAVGA
jgi:hypothetical protein